MHIIKTNGIMLSKEIIGIYSVESYEAHKYTVGQNAFQLRCVLSGTDRMLDSVPIFVTRGITFICHLGPSPGNVLL